MGSENYLNKIGIDTSQVGNIVKIIDKLQSGANKLSKITKSIQEDLNNAISKISESTDKVNNSVEQVQSELKTLNEILFMIIDVGRLYVEVIVKAFNNAIDKAQELADKFNNLTVQMNTEKSSLFSIFTEWIGLIVNIIDLSEKLYKYREFISLFAKSAGNALKSIASFAGSTLKLVGKGFKYIGVAVRSLTRIMMANPILAIITAIALAAYLIYDNWDNLKNFFSNLWSNITNFFKNGIKDILMYFGMSEEGANKTIKVIGNIFNAVIDYITWPFKTAWKFIQSLFSIWTDDNTSFTEKIGKTYSAIWDYITAPFKAAGNFISGLFDSWLGDGSSFTELLGGVFSSVLGFITAPFEAAWKFVNDLFDIWEDDTTSTTDKMGKTLWAIWDFITWPFRAAWDFVKGLFPTWVIDSEKFTTDFNKSFSKMYDFIVKPFQDAKKWIEDKFISVLDTIRGNISSGLSKFGINIGDDNSSGETPSNNQQSTSSPSRIMVLKNLETSVPTNSWLMFPQNNNVRNNAVTVNTTMHVNSSQEGIDNIFKIVDSKARQISDNSNTAMGSN